MPEKTLPHSTRWFLAAIALVGLTQVCFELTPSSYGVFLEMMQAPDAGPVIGSSRTIRSDEWGVATPLLQATLRNRFQRINETSFYHEDLRNYLALPLKDWSLIFKPQFWAFFFLPPAAAFSIYYALFMCGFLAGYHLLFRQLGVPAWLAIAATVLLYFSGFTQFWWTTLGPSLAVLPWLILIVLRPMWGWMKILLCVWAFPMFVLTLVYPMFQLTLAWGALLLILAFRPSSLRSRGDMAAILAGALSTAIVILVYYADVIPIMRNTVYPGHRISPAGDTPLVAVFSEFLPFLSFRLGSYQEITGANICEIGAMGSFFPLLTLCLLRYRSFKDHPAVRNTLLVLIAGFTAITLYQIAPLPAWIGKILFWDRGAASRWLFTSGLLLTVASLWIWTNKLISVHALRIGIFILLGPIFSLVLKFAWMIHRGEPGATAFSESKHEILLCGIALAVGGAACYLPAADRAFLLLGLVVFMNFYGFGRFNPLQPAGPIFDVPETDIVHGLRERAAASPGGVLANAQTFGATLNGIGLRAVAHVLMAPELSLFRSYFPAMPADRFNVIFNRFAHIHLTQDALPGSPVPDVIEVPAEVFLPVRNLRKTMLRPALPGACSPPAGGGIDRVLSENATLTIEGWAPWTGETDAQEVRVLSARRLRPDALSTITRPDIAERLQDYRMVKSGFQLRISSVDGKPLRPEELVLFAAGTQGGDIRLSCCGCP